MKLLEHGTHVNRDFAATMSDLTGAAQPVPGAVEVSNLSMNSARRYDKDKRAAPIPQSLGWIKQVYHDAIEYTGMTKETRGLGFMYGIALGLPIAIVGGGGGIFIMSFTMKFEDIWVVCTFLIGMLMAALGIAGGAYIFGPLIRNDLFKPQDLPIVFDRKHRKVYRLFQHRQPGFSSIFKRWPLMACEYDWDLLDAEHHIGTSSNGAVVRRDHFLIFLVRRSHDDASVIDSFQIANAHALGDGLVDPMWEHIRRFMQEDGPHLPDRSERLADLEAPTSWWQSMGTVSVFGPRFATHWKNAPAVTLFILLLFPVTLPIMLLWGTGHYLSFKTAIPVQWPSMVRERIGKPLSSSVERSQGARVRNA